LEPGWSRKFIFAWVPVAAPWNGAVNDFNTVAGGTLVASADQDTDLGGGLEFECAGCNPSLEDRKTRRGRGVNKITKFAGNLLSKLPGEVTKTMMTFPSMYWLMPRVDHSHKKPTDVSYLSVTTGGKTKTYAASEVHEYFEDVLHNHPGAQMLRYATDHPTTTDPGVPVHCVYSYNLPTDVNVEVTFANEDDLDPESMKIQLGDGDGTVPTVGSLDVCTRWKSTVRTYTLPGVVHSAMYNVQQVADVLLAVATEDEASLEAWTSPKPDDIRFMSAKGEIEVRDVTDDLFDVNMPEP